MTSWLTFAKQTSTEKQLRSSLANYRYTLSNQAD
uniref:Uncharacterized protein n=1 Tax=Anguilla anguilla TaxID=7936 RepID=A0A0E9STX0_ANGAN